MKEINIMDLISMSFEKHDLELQEKIKEVPGYNEAYGKYNELINALETKTRYAIDNEICQMESISRDIAFNEGFKMAVSLLLSSIQ